MVKVISPLKTTKWDIGTKEDTKIKRTLTLQAKTAIVVALILFVVIVTIVVVCVLLPAVTTMKDYWMPSHVSDSRLGKFQSAAVSTDAAPCAAIGKKVLVKGGSVIDAAISVLLCMGVVNPESMGLGGGFLMMYYNRTQRAAYYIDSREVAPGKATEDMYHGNASLAAYGGLAIAVPGEVAGYSEIHDQFGRLPWEDLFQPTIDMCRKGIPVKHHLANALRQSEQRMNEFEHLRNMFVNNKTGKIYQEDEIHFRHELANTLEAIAENRTRAIYGPSELSIRFLEDLKAAGSIIEESDLRGYSPRMLVPVTKVLRTHLTLYTAPPPGSGALLALILGVVDGYEDLGPDSPKTREGAVLSVHRIIEAFKFAYARRMEMQDDEPELIQKLVDELTSQEYADEIRSQIDDKKTYDDPGHYGVNVTIQEDHGTSHLSIIGPDGDAVSVTSTINTYFGSMVVSPSTGIILNNQMDDFSSPNITNYFGVPPMGTNHVRPGKRPLSSMSPTIITDADGDVRLVVGGNGGTQITTSVAQTIIRNLWLKEDIKKCIDAPRFHHQLLPDRVDHEAKFPKDIMGDLEAMGHTFHEQNKGLLGIIVGVSKEADGYLYANSDYRKGGEVDGF